MDTNEIRLQNVKKLIDTFRTQSEFADKIGKHNTQVSAWFKKDTTKKIGEKLAREIEQKLNLEIGSLDKSESQTSVVTMVPIKQYAIKACAGSGKQIDFEDELSPVGLPEKLLARKMLKPNNLFAIEVDGISMIPTYNPEDYIFIDTSQCAPIKNGDPYLIKYDNELSIKRLEYIGGEYTMRSDNPDKNKYPDRVVKPYVVFEILGKIVFRLGE